MKNNQTFLSTKKNQKNWELTSSLASDKSKKKSLSKDDDRDSIAGIIADNEVKSLTKLSKKFKIIWHDLRNF